MKETDLYQPMKRWLEQKGYRVRAEITHAWRSWDAIAVNGDTVVAIQMKLSLTRYVVYQCLSGSLFADYTYAVIGTKPHIKSETLRLCLCNGIGILSIKDNKLIGLYDPIKSSGIIPELHQRVIATVNAIDDSCLGGTPNIKGSGPAQSVQSRINDYWKLNPDATWEEVYKNVPNHYSSYRSMQGAMRNIQKRAAIREWLKQRKVKKLKLLSESVKSV